MDLNKNVFNCVLKMSSEGLSRIKGVVCSIQWEHHLEMMFPRKILALRWDGMVQLITYYQISSYEH